MGPGVVDRLGPRGEQPVQLREVRDLGGAGLGQLGQELAADGAEEPLDLPPPLGLTGQSQLILWITSCRGRAGELLAGFAAGAFEAA